MKEGTQTEELGHTKQPVTKEKATERVVFKVTPSQRYLVKQMVEELIKRGRAHDLTSSFEWLVGNWQAIDKAKAALEALAQSEASRKQALQLVEEIKAGGING